MPSSLSAATLLEFSTFSCRISPVPKTLVPVPDLLPKFPTHITTLNHVSSSKYSLAFPALYFSYLAFLFGIYQCGFYSLICNCFDPIYLLSTSPYDLQFYSQIYNSVYLLTYFHTLWLYSPLTALASLITGALPSLSTVFCHHLLTFISHRFLSTSSSHLNLCLLLLLFSLRFTLKYFNCPSLIHSYYMPNPFQLILFNNC